MRHKPPAAGKGRPKGSKNKKTAEVRLLALRMVSDPAYLASLTDRLNAGKAPHMEPVMWHYAYGKPKESVEVTGADGGPVQVIFRLRDGASA